MLPARKTLFIALAISPLLLLAPATILVVPLVLALDLLLFAVMAIEAKFLVRENDIELQRVIPDKLSHGADNEITYVIRNHSNRAYTIRFRDELPASFDTEDLRQTAKLAPRGVTEITVSVKPFKRGVFRLSKVRTQLSLAFAFSQFDVECPRIVRVYPNLVQTGKYEKLASSRRLSDYGIHRAKAISVGREFEHLRRYVSGDNYRDINWKATARVHHPITQVYQVERNQNVLICIDSGRHMTTGTGDKLCTKFDAAVNAALMVAYVAARSGDRAGLVVFSDKVNTYMKPRSTDAQINALTEELYNSHPDMASTSFMQLYTGVMQRQMSRSLVIVITDIGEGDETKDLVRHVPILGRKHLPVVVTMAEMEIRKLAYSNARTDSEALEKAAALELLTRKREALRSLSAKGVHVIDLEPDELTIGIVNKYVELKSRQAI
ncbi:MAG: DUF58 domain-containing protein [Planctomycetota bacterium]|nr:DUF58 domain-containing protein [Planctomycetota bacterium]